MSTAAQLQTLKLGLTCVAVATMAIAGVATSVQPADAAKSKRYSKKAKAVPPKTDGPLTLMVSLKKQNVVVYDKNGVVTSAPISSGRAGHRTPKGVFSILQKRRRHYSNLYRGAAMPNMQRITWSGIALHAGPLPGYPASHGCIRLPYSFSKKLFKMTEMGTRVIVTDAPAIPRSFAHSKLLKPLPPGDADAHHDLIGDGPDGSKKSASTADLLLGVTPANASEYIGLPSGVDRTRAAVDAYRRQTITRLEGNVEDADKSHKSTAEKLKAANAELKTAVQAQQKLQPEYREINKRFAAAKQALTATERSFRDFLLKSSAATDLEKAALEEEALEAEALRHASEVDLAQADLSAFDKVLGERREAVEQAKARRDEIKNRYITAQKLLLKLRKALKDAKKAYERRQRPITVLLSKRSKKIYVRQGYDPVLEADVEFENPDAPIGTHVFHATDYNTDGDDLVWQAVTAARTTLRNRRYRKGKKLKKKAPLFDAAWPAQTPGNALKRVKIPQDVVEALAEHIKPGSAIIITDERKSLETGKYTDLIVTTR
ncbi:MAG: L,D-transpeptidase family protein [Filomicrobium sp.]